MTGYSQAAAKRGRSFEAYSQHAMPFARYMISDNASKLSAVGSKAVMRPLKAKSALKRFPARRAADRASASTARAGAAIRGRGSARDPRTAARDPFPEHPARLWIIHLQARSKARPPDGSGPPTHKPRPQP